MSLYRNVVLWKPSRIYPFQLNWWAWELKIMRLPSYMDDLPVLVTPYGMSPVVDYCKDKNRTYFRILWAWFSITYDNQWELYR